MRAYEKKLQQQLQQRKDMGKAEYEVQKYTKTVKEHTFGNLNLIQYMNNTPGVVGIIVL